MNQPSLWLLPDASAVENAVRRMLDSQRSYAPNMGGREAQSPRPYPIEDGIAVIPVQGVLNTDWHEPPCLSSYRFLRHQLQVALGDADVSAVLLDIQSPGGTVAGCQDLAEFIQAVDRVKPIYAWTDGLAASGAYWLASAARRFEASPSAHVGSVGVIWTHIDSSDFYKQNGFKITMLRAGEFKALANDVEPLNKKVREVIQTDLDRTYELFRGAVAENRGLDAQAFETWAEGKVFLGADAVSAGLIDAASARDAYLRNIKEAFMDGNGMTVDRLRAEHPGLVADIEQAAMDTAKADGEARLATVRQDAVSLAGVLLGDEAAGKLEAALEAHLSADQAQKLGLSATSQPQAEATPEGEGLMSRMLAAIQQRDPAGVALNAGPPSKESPLAATFKRRHGGKVQEG